MFQKIKILPIIVLSFVSSGFVMQDAGAYTPDEIKAVCEKGQRECFNKSHDRPCFSWSDNAGSYAGGLFKPENELHKRLLRAWKPCEDAILDKKSITE